MAREGLPPMSRRPPECLEHDYGLVVGAFRPHPGGFESECWVADEEWFVKVWRSRRRPARLDLLHDLCAVGLPVPSPVRTVSGELHATWQGRPYAVFPYVHGHAQRDDEWRQAAQALRSVHELHAVDLPRTTMDEPDISRLREHLSHPWLRGRSHEVAASLSRLDATTKRARAKAVRHVLCHRDFGGDNLLLAHGHVVAILDWEQAVMAPREHDLWIAAEVADGESFLTEYGARDLDLDHVEYSLLSRALRDMAARVLTDTDEPGVDKWGFQRLGRLTRDLTLFRPFCA